MQNDNNPLIRIPAPRLAQLHMLAETYSVASPAAVIGRLINEKIAAGELPDEMPGADIRREGEEVVFTFDSTAPARLPVIGARALADALESVSGGDSQIINMSLPTSFAVMRRGRSGVAVSVPVTGEPKVYAFDLARDLARIIRKVAA